MTHSHLTPEEIEFLRNGALDEATATTDRISVAGMNSTPDVARRSTEQDAARAATGFDDDSIDGLRSIHDSFAKAAASALEGPLRSPVAMRVECVEQRTFSEFVFGLPNPTCLQVLTGNKSGVSPVFLEMPLDILFPMMDRLLGGEESDQVVRRALTEIERRLVSRLTGILLAQLSVAWRHVVATQWEVEQLESNPQMVRCVPPGEPCAVVVLDVSFSRVRGQIRVVFPYHAVAPLLDKISAQKPAPEGTGDRATGDASTPDGSVQLRVTLAESTLHRSDLLGLQVGDVLATESDASAPATVDIDGGSRFVGRIGTHEGHKAVRIEGSVDD